MNDIAQKILNQNRYMTISTVDEYGMPWAAPVWYISDSNKLFWWSPKVSQHQQNITHDPNVFITIFDSTASEGDGLGLYMKGTVSEVVDNELDNIIALYNKSTALFKLDHNNCGGASTTRLYEFIPTKSWINDGVEENGYWHDIRKVLDKL